MDKLILEVYVCILLSVYHVLMLSCKTEQTVKQLLSNFSKGD